VTRRLHVALPCIGLNTPVVALPDPAISDARARFSGYEAIMPVIFKDEPARAGEIDWGNVSPPKPQPDLETTYANFLQQVGTTTGLHEAQAKIIHSGRNATIENPGLGLRPGRLFIRAGKTRMECRILDWTADRIEVDLQDFAGLNRVAVEAEFERPNGRTVNLGTIRFGGAEA
jgi:hypothetical protein